MRREFAAQNHLAALSVMKPGLLRRFTLRVSLWSTVQLVGRFFRAGYLEISELFQFARWIWCPDRRSAIPVELRRQLGELAEKFITKAHSGLTGIWSNTVGFRKHLPVHGRRGEAMASSAGRAASRFDPRSGTRPIPTLRFEIDRCGDLQGLGAAMTEDEAQTWLSLSGSELRPVSALEWPKSRADVRRFEFCKKGRASVRFCGR